MTMSKLERAAHPRSTGNSTADVSPRGTFTSSSKVSERLPQTSTGRVRIHSCRWHRFSKRARA